MPNSLQHFADEFNSVISEASKFLCLTRGIEFQNESIERVDELKGKCDLFKRKAIGIEDEDLANAFLSLEIICKAIISELNMWVALKTERPDSTWEYLISAQNAVHTAVIIHEIAQQFAEHEERLSTIENIIFPHQSFVSTGGTVRKSVCSVCGQDYEDCDHTKGKAYMGRVCVREITETDLTEISLVSNPADKRCRIMSITDEGKQRDIMTWRVVENKE